MKSGCYLNHLDDAHFKNGIYILKGYYIQRPIPHILQLYRKQPPKQNACAQFDFTRPVVVKTTLT